MPYLSVNFLVLIKIDLIFSRLFAHEDDPDIDDPIPANPGHKLSDNTSQGMVCRTLFGLLGFCHELIIVIPVIYMI